MKKRLLKSLFVFLLICSAMLAFTACKKHECNFTQQIIDQAYFVCSATCTEKEKYYLSCECGKFGDKTFEVGEVLGHEFINYVSDNNATYDNDGTKTATCERGCGATDTLTDDGTKLQSHVEFKTLSLNEDNVLPNSVKEFSFVNEIEIFGYAEFDVARDKYGENIFLTGIVPLNEGDNSFYVFVKINGQYGAPIKVVLRRRPTYQVTLNYGNGQEIETQNIEEGFTIQQPETNPIRDGYKFSGWDFDFNNKITQNIRINAKWSANTNTPYKVEYYLENLDNNGYSLIKEETENLTGTTDTTVYAEIKEFAHFTAKSQSVGGKVKGDGSQVLKVYYTRNYYNVSTANHYYATISGSGRYANAQTATVTANVYRGYDFIGWYEGENFVSDKPTYSFNPIENVKLTAKIETKKEMANFKFDSSLTSCEIVGLIDNTTTEIFIPDYVTSIRYSAFYDCDSLASVTFGENSQLTSIGYSAFEGCGSLTSVNFGENSQLTSIGYSAFEGCDSLTSIEIPDAVTSIGYSAFEGCGSLTSIKIPDSVTSIGDYAFEGCGSLTSIEILDGVTSIGDCAFVVCGSLTSVTFGENSQLTSIGEEAFCWCGSLTSIEIPNRVTSIGYSAFSGCGSLTSIEIPNSVTSIGKSAFSYCHSLTSIEIPDGVTSIGESAFRNCDQLTSIKIPDSVTSIGDYAFEGCGSLTSIEIPDGVTSIGDCAFVVCGSLTSVTFGKNSQLTSIGFLAFYDCDSLTSIEIPDGVTNIGSSAFEGCDSLTSVTFGENSQLTSISSSAFFFCNSLTSITIPNSVTSIGDHAFECTFLKSITIPNSVTSIGDSAFYGCDHLKSVTIGSGVTSIGDSAFFSCTSLTSIKYRGSELQWIAIKKYALWDADTASYTITYDYTGK